MTETKYGQYIIHEPLGTIDTQPALKNIERFAVDGPKWGVDCIVGYTAVDRPLFMLKEPHTHPYGEFVCFLGGDPMKVRDFGAEVEMCLGEEQEKHLITGPTVVYIRPLLPHCPLNFRVVNKPIVLMTITLGKEYAQNPVTNE